MKITIVFTLFSLISFSLGGDINVRNNCNFNLWLVHKVNGGERDIGVLARGQGRTLQMNGSGNVYALKGCNNNGQNCETDRHGNILAEPNFTNDGKVWYDISCVDGFNLPMTVSPNRNSGGNCGTVRCHFNLNRCPQASRVVKNGQIVGCRNLNRDSENSEYARAMRAECPEAYSWSKDDRRRPSPMRDCNGGHQGLTVTFC